MKIPKNVMDIRPLMGVGPINFGMPVEQVRQALGLTAFPFQKSEDLKFEVDAFDNDSIHVYYREPGVCEAVELFCPTVVTFQEHLILGQPFSDVVGFLQKVDPLLKISSSGLRSEQLGIAVTAPALKAPLEPIESVFLFEHGYFSRYMD
jgi:hypothetical protein